jgi:hypothetical protein
MMLMLLEYDRSRACEKFHNLLEILVKPVHLVPRTAQYFYGNYRYQPDLCCL